LTFLHTFRSVSRMISKSFEIVSQELDLTKRKKQALDDLLASARISQPTYEHLEKGLTDTIGNLEAQQRSLADKMTGWADELEEQIQLLELLLANLEIHHATGEIDEEAYDKQNRAILLGIEATKQDLVDVRNILSKTVSEGVETPSAPTTPETTEELEQIAESEAEDTSVSEVEEQVEEVVEETVESEIPTFEPTVEQPSTEPEKPPEYHWSA
jgi:polyhydroxyalkanoate synthesis regulator phasin